MMLEINEKGISWNDGLVKILIDSFLYIPMRPKLKVYAERKKKKVASCLVDDVMESKKIDEILFC
jgi:hypothetical protein